MRPAVSPQAGSTPNIALLDVSYIFKNHPRFKAMMDEMKSDVDRAESDVNRDAMRSASSSSNWRVSAKAVRTTKPWKKRSPASEADLTVKVQLQRKEFLCARQRFITTFIRKSSRKSTITAANKGIDMVLRFNGDPVDVDKPDSVLSYINKPVVWYDKSRDITPSFSMPWSSAAASRLPEIASAVRRYGLERAIPFKSNCVRADVADPPWRADWSVWKSIHQHCHG